jgi:hypothetical protein
MNENIVPIGQLQVGDKFIDLVNPRWIWVVKEIGSLYVYFSTGEGKTEFSRTKDRYVEKVS